MIRRIGFIFTFLLLGFSFAFSQYEASEIPKELLSRASATIREDHTTYDIKSPSEMIETGRKVITIHNSSGDGYAGLQFGYDKSKQIKSIKGEVLDADGKTVKKFTIKDFKDYSASDEGTMFTNTRIKHLFPSLPSYPFTVVMDYEIRHNQTLILQSWRPDFFGDVSVQKSSYEILANPDYKLRILKKNLKKEGKEEMKGKQKSYYWNIENISAVRSEPYSPNRHETGMRVLVVPESFEYYKHAGEVNDWKSYGSWMNTALLKDKRQLPEVTVAKVKEITKDLKTDKEKAKALYEYLQKKTRYISVQIGIGGQEPFPAADVDRLGYGDCKALVNYMQALLDVVDIPSYYCIVEAGNRKMDVEPEFANLVDGNHIILCLPFENDYTWLECTSQDLPFGYLGDFTDDRLVLAVTEEGGKVMRTEVYNFEQNLQNRKGSFVMDENGKISGKITTEFSGTQFENHFYNVKKIKDEQVKLLRRSYDINRIQFNEIKYTINQQDNLSLTEELKIEADDFGIKNGTNMTIYPNFLNRSSSIPDIRNRTNLVRITRGYTDIDETEIELPEKLSTNIIPVNKKLEVPMGSYEFKVDIKDGKMICYRKLQLREGSYPATSYAEFSKFMLDVSLTDGTKYNLGMK
ncbi:DUF3857 domain-containing transglutaminase family protein [Sphingobacterium endophyticum]|uniref:DUF3857 domain-containing transglutaminase family protein n=1 Tax=Sphingobacterium endophyticum TaxID=2546448 RepID=UPI0012E0F67F|nr:DUF3857 domain-containing transglutaminase family protein [Sphingobacterium endophyticum]